MNKRILGIDMGTNSIGWAIVERNELQGKLIDCGVNIFQEGVAREIFKLWFDVESIKETTNGKNGCPP